VQTSENLARVGVIDDVVELAELRDWVAGILSVTNGHDGDDELAHHGHPSWVDPWTAIESTRGQRPGPLEVLDLLTDRTDLHGTGTGQTGQGVRVSLGRLRGRRVVMVVKNRRMVTPSDLRVAQRGLRLAERLRLPVVTLIDTPGGEMSAVAENSAMAGEIARTLLTLTSMTVPTVSCVMGQGCGGAALALIPARHRICMENGWVSPLPPEGASVIMHRSPDRAADLAQSQGVGAFDMLDAGVVDEVAAEGTDLVAAVADAVVRAL
jgi:acetyl-CoA carboxylase carboxyl transferase subunit beta